MRDERLSKQEHDFYRLTLGEYSFADSVFPLGWTRNSPVEAEFSGGNLEKPIKGTVELHNTPENAQETLIQVPGTTSSISFLLWEGPEEMESESNGWLQANTVMNGHIEQSNETDRYQLAVKEGESWAFELLSGELAGSSLYGVMSIADSSGVIAVAGKYAGDPNPYIISMTGQTASRPFMNLRVPPGQTELEISVEDLLQRGGKSYSYRLTAHKQGPNFLLRLDEPYINIPSDGSVIVSVTAEHRGYFGPIQLYVKNAPEDLSVSGGHLSTTSTLGNTRPRFETGRLTLTSKSGTEARRLLNLVVRGRSTEEDLPTIDRRAIGPGIRVAVAGTKQSVVDAEWLGYDLPAHIKSEQGATLKFEKPLQLRLVLGAKLPKTKWTFIAHQSGVQLAEKVAKPKSSGDIRFRAVETDNEKEAKPKSGEFVIAPHERTSLGIVDVYLTAKIKSGDKERMIYSEPLVVEIVNGYKLSSPESQLVLESGGEGIWEGAIWREPTFYRMVKVSAVGLPKGVECSEPKLNQQETQYSLKCRAEPGVTPDVFELEIQAASVLSDEGTTPYLAEPVRSTLEIRR